MSEVKPIYPARDYHEFCRWQKRKGLQRRYWKSLPKMWKEEKAFRLEFENSLKDLTNPLRCNQGQPSPS